MTDKSERNIKFRFWDKRVNKFRYDLLISNTKVWDIYNDFGGMFSSGLVKEDVSSHVVVQQYTGLKDKNGVDIYEGDIVEIYVYSYTVHWNTIKAKWELGDRWAFIPNDICQVIGHIFEGVDK